MAFNFGPRRAVYIDITDEIKKDGEPLSGSDLAHFEKYDAVYRALCAVMYNYVPMSGHPGGSISSGRFVASLVFDTMDYELADPNRKDADIISYAAGHKALGLYAMWALRNEIASVADARLLAKDIKNQLRLEDLLGFRRNPVTKTPLFKKFNSKALDGHPTPVTPFIKLATGASGVGVAASIGLAFGAKDYFGKNSPWVHIVEGEGGMTPGRVAESFASAGTSSLENAVIHIDWNQASIDSEHVCRDGRTPGDYVQWNPMEFSYLYDWNVIYVPDGKDFQQVIAAQKKALEIKNGQPTAIVYKTIKGWQYGIEGRASHGAGHKLCTESFYKALAGITGGKESGLPKCTVDEKRCKGSDSVIMEECYWETLKIIRKFIAENKPMTDFFAKRVANAKLRLDKKERGPRKDAPRVDKIYELAEKYSTSTPTELTLKPGTSTTLRAALGECLHYLNKASGGSVLAAAADLLGSTSINLSAGGFPAGFFNAETNPGARLLSIGGICEDAIAGVLSGLSAMGHHIGAGSSYGAFIAALGHIAARLHCIGNQARHEVTGDPYKPFILICAHAGLKTGEDGPTHADPQALQLLQENFPTGTFITLTPWDPQEVWPLTAAALKLRPAVIAPFVTRPNEKIFDRKALDLGDAHDAVKGIYKLCSAKGKSRGTLILQGSGVTNEFVEKTIPMLKKEGIELNVYYVASAELFDLLPPSEQKSIISEPEMQEAMGITGFTLPTMHKWIRSDFGRAMTLHPFKKGHYLGSGQAEMVLKEADLDGEGQFKGIMKYLKEK